jgi:hypothetical protein
LVCLPALVILFAFATNLLDGVFLLSGFVDTALLEEDVPFATFAVLVLFAE